MLHCSQHSYNILYYLDYLDDFMGVVPKEMALEAYKFLGDLLVQLGLTELTNKAVPPSIVMMCLGFQIDTVSMTTSPNPGGQN